MFSGESEILSPEELEASMRRFIRKMYSIAPEDDVKLERMARLSGTGNKSAELRTLIRREYLRVMEAQEIKIERPSTKEAQC